MFDAVSSLQSSLVSGDGRFEDVDVIEELDGAPDLSCDDGAVDAQSVLLGSALHRGRDRRRRGFVPLPVIRSVGTDEAALRSRRWRLRCTCCSTDEGGV